MTYDPEGHREPDAHDRVVVRAESRDRGAYRGTVAATSGTAASSRTTRDSAPA